MKKILLNLMLLLPIIGCAQTNYNELTIAEYYNITFNNISITHLSTFQGDINDLNQLYTIFENTCNDPEGEAKTL